MVMAVAVIDLRRKVRHLITDSRSVRRLLPAVSLANIHRTIVAGEARHDGEVRFCIEAALPWSYLRRNASARERAVMLFSKLRVWDTERNTGVLLYILLADKAVEIVADRGIANRVETEEWAAICRDLSRAIRAGGAEEGVSQALGRINELLAQHFPPRADNPNELPDSPVVL
jgi:uncharacterized membrane protein